MQIETYFQQLRELIDACPAVQSLSITYDKRGTHEGFIRGEIYFVDALILHLRVFVDVETTVEHLLYVYQYMNPRMQLQFCYVNTGHHKQLNLPTYPHHKHDSSEEKVIPASAADLETVLGEVETLVQLP